MESTIYMTVTELAERIGVGKQRYCVSAGKWVSKDISPLKWLLQKK